MGELCTQRDLNCLADPDRSTRKRTLEKLAKDVAAGAGKPVFTAELVKRNLDLLHKPLLKCVRDPAEKCRELSVTILSALLPLVNAADVEAVAGETLAGIRERIGVVPQAEESEEVRLELLRLTKAVLEAQPSTVRDHVDPVAAILEKSSYDKFPDVKKLASEVTVWLCAQKEAVHLKDYCPGLNKALLLNLTHQQQKIRVAALQAVGAVVVLNPSTLKEALPCVAKLNLDRTHQLRQQVLHVMATWLKALDRGEASKILPILLHGAADELEQVQDTCVTLMKEVGQSRTENASDGGDVVALPAGLTALPLQLYPKAFKGRPCLGARELVGECLEALITHLLMELSDWSATTRVKAAATMLNVLVYAEDKIGAHAEVLLMAFSKACMDDESLVCEATEKCIRLSGAFISAEVFVSIIDSNLRSSNASVGSQKACLAVLATLLEGSSREDVASLLPTLCDMVADMELSLPEHEDFQVHLLRVVLACISTGGDACATVRRRLLTFLLRLEAMHVTCPLVAERARGGVALLGSGCGLAGGEAELLELEALPVLQQICSNAAEWRRDSLHLYIFDTMIRRAGRALAPHLAICVPVFALAADHNRDADVRSTLLLLLDDLLRQQDLHPALTEHAGALLTGTVIPVCVWRAGKVAAALRKGSVSCLLRLVQARLVTGDALLDSLGKGFEPGPLDPVLRSSMDDDDADVRFMTCGLLSHVFAALEGRLDDEQVRNYYIDLLKRMDDSNDAVRIQCAAAFENFMASVPRNYDSAQYDYIVRGLVVHLDDQNQEVRDAVLPAVLASASVNPTQFINIVTECRSKHRVTSYCDEAIARAKQLAKHSAGEL